MLKEVGGFYPYLNKGAVVFLDDIDSFPYMRGQRKDNVDKEIANRSMDRLVERIFCRTSRSWTSPSFRGSTGLARLDKRSPRGGLHPARHLPCPPQQAALGPDLPASAEDLQAPQGGREKPLLDPAKYN